MVIEDISQYIEVHEMGQTDKPQVDLLVTTLHGETAQDGPLIKGNPDMIESLDDSDREVLHTFLDLDADTYSEPLAREFILQLLEVRPDLKVRWAQVKAHRAILDCNRARPEDAIRKLWLDTEEHELIRARLSCIHALIMSKLSDAMACVPTVFDIHTMYPFSPTLPKVSGSQAVMEQRGGLAGYVSAYFDGRTYGERRPLDVIVTNGEGVHLSDKALAVSVLRSTQDRGINSRADVPYNFGKKTLVSKLLLDGRIGVTVDVPKDLLRAPKNEAPIYLEPEVHNGRVEEVASTFVDAWLKRFPRKKDGGWGQI